MLKTTKLKVLDGPQSSDIDPVWLGDVGSFYITPGVNQTVTINSAGVFERILITTIAESFNSNFSMPSNGIIQNDSGSDLICDVTLTYTWSSVAGTNDFSTQIELNNGGWSAIAESIQRRGALTTISRMDELNATVVIPDGGQVAGSVSNLGSANDVRFSSYKMYVKPKDTA